MCAYIPLPREPAMQLARALKPALARRLATLHKQTMNELVVADRAIRNASHAAR